MSIMNWKERLQEAAKANEFDVETGDFSHLVVEQAGSGGFHYFYDAEGKRLIKSFVLKDGPQVATMCDVTLIKKEGRYSPRLRLRKKDKTKLKRGQLAPEQMAANNENVLVKAAVDTDDCYENFWKLIAFLQSFKDLDLPAHSFRVSTTEEVELTKALQGHDKQTVLAAVKASLGGKLSEQDVQILVDRKKTLLTFGRMLNDPKFFEAERVRRKKSRPEDVWQEFFEENTWIFGYGLTLLSCEAVRANRLEQVTTGANVFGGGGKRIDAAMRTRGFIQSLLFAEIKRHDTPLLKAEPYRPPDVYQASVELSGAVSQVQKTAHKAIKGLEDLHQQHTPEGDPEFEVSTIKPRQVVVIGNLNQLASGDGINVEKLTSFELYRRGQQEVEILTFDELLARAQYIVSSSEGLDDASSGP